MKKSFFARYRRLHMRSQRKNVFFSRGNGVVYRNGEVYCDKVDRITEKHLEKKLIRLNHAKVLYDTTDLEIRDMDRKES